LSLSFELKAAVVFGAIAVAAAAGARRHHLSARFGAANGVTLARGALTALVLGFIGERRSPTLAATIVALSALAMALDGVDGWLARRTATASAFGARFDLEVDALLILGLSVLVWDYDKAGVWVMLSGLLRYLFIAAGWALTWMRQPLPPSRRRQTICVVQIAALIVAMVPAVTPPISTWIAGASLAALAASFLLDVVWLAQGKSQGSKLKARRR
jgi:phosphatidylglycerophosphate synthase